MRPLTSLEKDFNAIGKSYSHKAYTAQDFSNNKELKKAFASYKKSREEPVIPKSDLSNISQIEMGYINFFEHKDNKLHDNTEATEIDCTMTLFELISPIQEISCRDYLETEIYGFVIDEEDTSINDKVKEWHKKRRTIDKIKPFIKSMFPRWDKAGKKEKSELKNTITKYIESLTCLGNDTTQLEMVSHFMHSGLSLNKINDYKAEILLKLKLPHINSKEIAKKIIKYSKL